MTLRPTLLCLAALLLAPMAARADLLIMPQPADRDGPITVQYRLDRPARAKGHLDFEWTDIYGRVVDRQRIPVALEGQIDTAFKLDLRRAVAMQNQVTARLALDGMPPRQAKAEFIARPAGRPFDDYQIVMWQQQNAVQWAALKRIGVTAGIVFGDREGRGPAFTNEQIAPLVENDLRWYVENIATDYYAAYHRWTQGKPKNWLFQEAQRRFAANPLDPAALRREPSLADPDAMRRITDRLAATVRLHERYAPLFYNLSDELGIADLSAHWDFDFSPGALAAFRTHLQGRYGSLAALNTTWETSFASWDTVLPRTTREVIHQLSENFAAWAEFKGWMDEAFADAIRAGAEAVRRSDAKAATSITGGQVPGWGGWNYAALTGAVGVMETANDGGAFEIVRGLDPSLVLLTTLFSRGGGREEHMLWRQLLRGGRGAVIWDSRNEFVAPDGSFRPRGRDAATYFPLLRGGIGTLLMQAPRQADAIALLYSQASFRTRWLLDRQPDGDAWSSRSAEDEHNDDNEWRRSTLAYLAEFRRFGLDPRFLSSRQVEAGELGRGEIRMLVLPHAIALSPAEAQAIRDFIARGGIAVADTDPGVFDHLSRRLPTPALADLFVEFDGGQAMGGGRGLGATLPPQPAEHAGEANRRLERLLRQADLLPTFTLARDDGSRPTDLEVHRYRNGDVTLLAIHANLPRLAASEDPRALDPRRIRLTLPQRSHVYDVREGIALGRADRIDLGLDPVRPALLAIADSPLPVPTLEVSGKLRRGETGAISLSPGGPSAAAIHVYRVTVLDPFGAEIPHYSTNLVAQRGRATLSLPIAFNDPTGNWKLRVTDRLSGVSVSATIEVVDP